MPAPDSAPTPDDAAPARPPRRARSWPGRKRWQAWWAARHRPATVWTLTQRNVYILPTRAGLMYALTLMVLLLASINFQLNLGYLLTFLLAGAGAVAMHMTHASLRGLSLHLRTGEPAPAGDPAEVEVLLHDDGRTALSRGRGAARHGLSLWLRPPSDDGEPARTWCDVPAGGHAGVPLAFVPPRRGRHALPRVVLETRFPLGLFRAWTEWQPAATVLAWPRAEHPAPALPADGGGLSGSSRHHRGQSGDTEGVRPYRRGDPPKLVAWKKAATGLATGGDLVSRDTQAAARRELWLDWQHTGGDTEARLARLAGWVDTCEAHGLRYGLRLPGVELPPGDGDAHRRACLERLALW